MECERLRYVDVYGNQLHDLTPLGKLHALTYLDAAANGLAAVGELPVSLEELDLSDNRLAELPRQISSLRDLRRLDLSGNRLTSSTIAVLGGLNLAQLFLDYNDLSEPPLALAAAPHSVRFSALGNPFGELPAEAIPPGRVDTAQLERELRERISGAPEAGRLYYDAPLYSPNFAVAAGTPAAASAVANLYYRHPRFRAMPAVMQLADGQTLPLAQLRRGGALLRVAKARGPARLSFEPTQKEDAYNAAAFVARAATRLPTSTSCRSCSPAGHSLRRREPSPRRLLRRRRHFLRLRPCRRSRSRRRTPKTRWSCGLLMTSRPASRSPAC